LGENAGILYFLQIIFFAIISEFILAIRDPKLKKRGLECTLNTAQNKRLFLLLPQKTQNLSSRAHFKWRILRITTLIFQPECTNAQM